MINRNSDIPDIRTKLKTAEILQCSIYVTMYNNELFLCLMTAHSAKMPLIQSEHYSNWYIPLTAFITLKILTFVMNCTKNNNKKKRLLKANKCENS